MTTKKYYCYDDVVRCDRSTLVSFFHTNFFHSDGFWNIVGNKSFTSYLARSEIVSCFFRAGIFQYFCFSIPPRPKFWQHTRANTLTVLPQQTRQHYLELDLWDTNRDQISWSMPSMLQEVSLLTIGGALFWAHVAQFGEPGSPLFWCWYPI